MALILVRCQFRSGLLEEEQGADGRLNLCQDPRPASERGALPGRISPRQPWGRCRRARPSVERLSVGFSVASVTVGRMVRRSWSGASIVCLSTLAMRRATTWALRRSVSVKAARIEPSCSRQAKSMLRTSRLNRRAASMLARRSVVPRTRSARPTGAAAVLGLRHGAVEVAPERVACRAARFPDRACPRCRAISAGA